MFFCARDKIQKGAPLAPLPPDVVIGHCNNPDGTGEPCANLVFVNEEKGSVEYVNNSSPRPVYPNFEEFKAKMIISEANCPVGR